MPVRRPRPSIPPKPSSALPPIWRRSSSWENGGCSGPGPICMHLDAGPLRAGDGKTPDLLATCSSSPMPIARRIPPPLQPLFPVPRGSRGGRDAVEKRPGQRFQCTADAAWASINRRRNQHLGPPAPLGSLRPTLSRLSRQYPLESLTSTQPWADHAYLLRQGPLDGPQGTGRRDPGDGLLAHRNGSDAAPLHFAYAAGTPGVSAAHPALDHPSNAAGELAGEEYPARPVHAPDGSRAGTVRPPIPSP